MARQLWLSVPCRSRRIHQNEKSHLDLDTYIYHLPDKYEGHIRWNWNYWLGVRLIKVWWIKAPKIAVVAPLLIIPICCVNKHLSSLWQEPAANRAPFRDLLMLLYFFQKEFKGKLLRMDLSKALGHNTFFLKIDVSNWRVSEEYLKTIWVSAESLSWKYLYKCKK